MRFKDDETLGQAQCLVFFNDNNNLHPAIFKYKK